jgi:YD repeat-containing protein
VQSDLAALASIDSSENVVVTQEPNGGWQIRFTGTMGGTYQNQITATSSLTGGTSPTVAISTLSLGGDNGNVVDTTDPDDIDTRSYYDPLGNVVQTVQDFTNGAVSASSNKTTDFTYRGKAANKAENTELLFLVESSQPDWSLAV